MTLTVNFHDLTDVECYPLVGCASWALKSTDDGRDTVTMFVPRHVAEAIVAAWDDATAGLAAENAEMIAADEAFARNEARNRQARIDAVCNPEPELLDPETVYAREEVYRRGMIAAGRGHLVGE